MEMAIAQRGCGPQDLMRLLEALSMASAMLTVLVITVPLLAFSAGPRPSPCGFFLVSVDSYSTSDMLAIPASPVSSELPSHVTTSGISPGLFPPL